MDQNREWFDPARESELHGLDQLRAADALVLGRETYEFFSSVWPKQTDSGHGFAERINRMPKHVASRTLSGPLDWNARLIGGDLALVSPDAVGRGTGSPRRRAPADPAAADRRHDVQLRSGSRQLPSRPWSARPTDHRPRGRGPRTYAVGHGRSIRARVWRSLGCAPSATGDVLHELSMLRVEHPPPCVLPGDRALSALSRPSPGGRRDVPVTAARRAAGVR